MASPRQLLLVSCRHSARPVMLAGHVARPQLGDLRNHPRDRSACAPRHAGIKPSKRSQGMAVQVSVSAWPNERMMITTLAATVSSGASKMSR
jgi:hypothetical protein